MATQPAHSKRRKPLTGNALGRENGQRLLYEMIRIRRFEEMAAQVYQEGKIRGFLHLYIGEEAVAVGAMQALGPDDAVVATYREHGQAMARGLPAGALMAEMYGKATGCSGGRGGSMHFFDVGRRFYGGHAIVGGGLPVAVGLALADQMRGLPRVTACFFGDGAVAEGEFHESLNLAALWRLPVLFICENNLYAMGTHVTRAQAETDLTRKAASYTVRAQSVDGMDVLAVASAAQHAADAIRRGEGPHFLECRTYRYRAHSMADPELYRPKEEVEAWRRADPIARFAHQLSERDLLTPGDQERIERDVDAEVAQAVAFAEEGPWEPVEALLKHVMVRGSA